jgi:hypothetical protein
MNLVEIAKLPQSKLVEWLKWLRRGTAAELEKILNTYQDDVDRLRMRSFHEGRLHAIDQILARMHPGHLQHPERWTGEHNREDECDHWAVWACSKCNGFAQPVSRGACNCHWPDELQGIPIDVYDDSGGQAPVFDVRHPALVREAEGESNIWRQLPKHRSRARLPRYPTSQEDLLEGLAAYHRCFEEKPASILISYRGAYCGVAIFGKHERVKHVDPETSATAAAVDIPALLRWRYTGSTHFNAAELAASLSVEGLPYEQIPDEWWPSVRAFRKLRQDARLRKAERFIEGKL